MRLKRIKNAEEIILSSNYLIDNPFDYKNKWSELFDNNNNKIELELGCGKGKYIINKAINNPNINFIAIEKYATVLVNAVKLLQNLNINNLKLINTDVNNICDIFGKEISKIYLNFSDPWPKARHEKRRLTSKRFLEKYEKVFKNKKVIEQKTDNDELFEYSLKSFEDFGYKIIEINRNYFDNITTEYEDKFIKKGKNINYVRVERE